MEDQPLSKVPTRALYALHRSIEKQHGLIEKTYTDGHGGKCALASLGVRHKYWEKDLVKKCSEIGLSTSLNKNGILQFDSNATRISALNSDFKGPPGQRREFMLRHIVEELRQRGLSIEGANYQGPSLRAQRANKNIEKQENKNG